MKRRKRTTPPSVPQVIKGPEAEREATERGIQFIPYSGSVRVTGPFYIRAGSVSIYRGFDLVAQWEDAVPGIREVKLNGMESVQVNAEQMLIASPYPVTLVAQTGSTVLTPVQNLSNILGPDGYLSLTVARGGVPDGADYPWFYVAGSIAPVALTGQVANQVQVDTSLTRNFSGPQGSVQFRSSNSLAASNGGVAFQGVVLQASSASARDRPFFHDATVSAFGGESTTAMIAFYEQANVAALWGFSTGGLPAAVVRAFYTLIPIYRGSNAQTVEINAQIYAPGWIPAAGNGIMAYGLNTNIPGIAPITYIHASGIAPLMFGTQQPRAIPFYLGLRSTARV